MRKAWAIYAVVILSICLIIGIFVLPVFTTRALPKSELLALLQQKPAPPVLKLAVMANGRITINGAPATMESLRESLKTLAQQKGVVWYYREAANTEPPPVVKEVVQAIVDARLSVRLSTRPDYSDTIGPDGKPVKQ